MLNSRHCMNPITYLPSLYYQMCKILNFSFLQWVFYICIFFSILKLFALVQFSSVSQSCLTLCDPMNCSTPGLPVHHQLLESTQTHVHWVGDAIQPSYPLSSLSPPALNLSQHQGLLKWVSSSHQVANLEPLGKSNYEDTGKPKILFFFLIGFS